MRNVRKIIIGFFVFVIIAVTGSGIYYWPVDSRLTGTFRSDKDETIAWLKTNKQLSEKQLKILKQMYGHSTYVIEGHKIIIDIEPHTIEGYPEGSKTAIEKGVTKSHFILKKMDENKAILITLPSQFWHIEDTQIYEIEFEDNGFWLIVDSLGGGSSFKEKFTRVKS